MRLDSYAEKQILREIGNKSMQAKKRKSLIYTFITRWLLRSHTFLSPERFSVLLLHAIRSYLHCVGIIEHD